MGHQMELYDVTIIGGGTTGLFVAFYSGMRELKTKLIESSSVLGGKVTKFYPEKLIYDIGGIPQITGDALIKQMKEQASKHNPTMVLNQWIERITKDDEAGVFKLVSQDGSVHYSKTVILTTGMGEFKVLGPKIDLEAYRLTNMHDNISNPDQFRDKKVLINSNNRIGIEWALTLVDSAKEVYLVNQQQTFQHATDEELKKLELANVMVKLESEVTGVKRSQGFIKQVVIRDKHNAEEIVPIDDLLIYDGIKLSPTPFKEWGMETDKGRVVVNNNMQTTVDGLFAAGDATNYDGKTMLISSGYTEGITAVNSAKKYINPKASAQVYSTVIYRK